MYELMKAVYDRWVAAGLDDSIAELYPAGNEQRGKDNQTGSPPETSLPRAEYMVYDPPPQIKTRNSRTNQVPAVIRVWATHSETDDASIVVAQYVGVIKSAYVNADEVGMALATGDLLEVDDGGSTCVAVDDNVWEGSVTLLLRNRRNNRAPS